MLDLVRWDRVTRLRIRECLERVVNPLQDMLDRDANESDTRLIVTDILCDALGYDKYTDLSTEYAVSSDYADYGLRVNGKIVALVEVKRCGLKLTPRHLKQVQNYALNDGVEWMILTNGIFWHVYHITAALPVIVDNMFEIDITTEEGFVQATELLLQISKESFSRNMINTYWQKSIASSPKNIAKTLMSDEVINRLRLTLRSQTGFNCSAEYLRETLETSILRPEMSHLQ